MDSPILIEHLLNLRMDMYFDEVRLCSRHWYSWEGRFDVLMVKEKWISSLWPPVTWITSDRNMKAWSDNLRQTRITTLINWIGQFLIWSNPTARMGCRVGSGRHRTHTFSGRTCGGVGILNPPWTQSRTPAGCYSCSVTVVNESQSQERTPSRI